MDCFNFIKYFFKPKSAVSDLSYTPIQNSNATNEQLDIGIYSLTSSNKSENSDMIILDDEATIQPTHIGNYVLTNTNQFTRNANSNKNSTGQSLDEFSFDLFVDNRNTYVRLIKLKEEITFSKVVLK